MVKKVFFLHCLSLLCLTGVWASPSDSVTVVQVFFRHINNGQLTPKFFTGRQFTLDDDGNLIRNVYFNDSSAAVSHYNFLFYREAKIVSSEFYDSANQVVRALRYDYLPTGLKQTEFRYQVLNGQSIADGKKSFTYSRTGELMAVKDYSAANKLLATHQFKNYLHNTPTHISVKNAKPYPDRVVTTTTRITLNDIGQPLQEVTNIRLSDKTEKSFTRSYEYNNTHLKTSEKLTDGDGNLIEEKIFEYYDNGRLRIFTHKDGEGNYLFMESYTYHRRPFFEGDVKSIFE